MKEVFDFLKDVIKGIFEPRPEDNFREGLKDIIHEVMDERDEEGE